MKPKPKRNHRGPAVPRPTRGQRLRRARLRDAGPVLVLDATGRVRERPILFEARDPDEQRRLAWLRESLPSVFDPALEP